VNEGFYPEVKVQGDLLPMPRETKSKSTEEHDPESVAEMLGDMHGDLLERTTKLYSCTGNEEIL